jgi:long-subunit fatty acid transport protein
LTWPSTVGVGIAHWLNDCHRVSLDGIWVHWENAFDTLGLQLTHTQIPLVINDQFPFLWRDSISLRLGYEYFLTPCSVLRAGYVYNSNQVPDGTLTPYIPATLEHGFSVGAGKSWNDYSVDIAYQFSFGPDRRVGTSDVVGGDFNNSLFQTKAHWLAVSLTRQF